MEANFRLAQVDDLATLLRFMQELYLCDGLATFDETIARPALTGILQDASLGQVWIIQRQQEAIGYVVLTLGYSLEYGGRDAFVDELFIREGDRGKGIGTQTLQFLNTVCCDLGIRALHLEVERSNTKAQSLYRKVGFADHDRYLMTRSISVRANP